MLSQAVSDQLSRFPRFNPMLQAQGPDLISQAVSAARQRIAPYGPTAALMLPMLLEAGEGGVPEGEPPPEIPFTSRPTTPLNLRGRQTWPDPANPYPMKTRPLYGPYFELREDPGGMEIPVPLNREEMEWNQVTAKRTKQLKRPFGSRTSRLHPETTPLPSVGAAEPRFHGTPDPMTIMGDPLKHSWHGNLHGPGLYTTDDYTVASGYGEGGSGVVYRVYQVKPVKLLDTEAPIPRKVFSDLVGKDPEWGREFMTGPYSKSRSWQYVKDRINQIHMREEAAARVKGGVTRYGADQSAMSGFYADPNARMLELINQLKKEGYGGLMHEGGLITRGPSHQVKIYWDPENQVQMRQVSAQAGTSDFGRVPPPLPERMSNVAKRHLKEMEERRDQMIRRSGGTLSRPYLNYF